MAPICLKSTPSDLKLLFLRVFPYLQPFLNDGCLKIRRNKKLKNSNIFYFHSYNGDNSNYFEIYEVRSKTVVSARFSVYVTVSK